LNTPLTILGIAGSLRKASFNRAALRAAQQLAPEGVKFEIFDLEGIPPFNQDEETRPPERVAQFKQRIRAADAILIVTPEYNYSVPGVLKNAIDWASRPYGDNSWDGKPVAVMGASVGAMGTSRAQYHLRQVFVFLNMYPLNRPEVMITNAPQRFDEKGNLRDEDTKAHIQKLLVALVAWAKHHEGGRRATAASE
jgi:chromate reductase